jgi:hypothetical protein
MGNLVEGGYADGRDGRALLIYSTTKAYANVTRQIPVLTVHAKHGMDYSAMCSLTHFLSAPEGCIRSDVSRKMPLFYCGSVTLRSC